MVELNGAQHVRRRAPLLVAHNAKLCRPTGADTIHHHGTSQGGLWSSVNTHKLVHALKLYY